MAHSLIVSHHSKANDDCDPVAVVRDDRAVGGRVLPAENGVEDSPSATAIEFWVAELGNVSCIRMRGVSELTLTCHTLWPMSYDPGPAPVSAASPPVALFQSWAWKYHTALEKRPAATRYKRHVEMIRKNWSLEVAPPLKMSVKTSHIAG